MGEMLVALESFTDALGERYLAGISYADSGCDCVRRHPTKWGAQARTVDTAGYREQERLRSARSSTRPRRARQPLSLVARTGVGAGPPSVRAGRSATRAWLSTDAHQEILRQLEEVERWYGVLEVGGALFGGQDGDELWIGDATGNGEISEARNTESSLWINLEHVDRMAERHRSTTGWAVRGHWHSQPRGNTRPSPADIETWLSWYRHYGERPFLGLICSEHRDGGTWGYPVLTAYVVEAGPAGPPLIQHVRELTIESGQPIKPKASTPSWRL